MSMGNCRATKTVLIKSCFCLGRVKGATLNKMSGRRSKAGKIVTFYWFSKFFICTGIIFRLVFLI